MSPRFVLGRENVPCVAEVVNRSLKADCTDFKQIEVFPMSSCIAADWSIIADTSKKCYSFSVLLKFCDLGDCTL